MWLHDKQPEKWDSDYFQMSFMQRRIYDCETIKKQAIISLVVPTIKTMEKAVIKQRL
jgi:hypothetical protein